jgi:hypothetical protein
MPLPVHSQKLALEFPDLGECLMEIQRDAIYISQYAVPVIKSWNADQISYDFIERNRLFNFLTFYTKIEAHDTLLSVQKNCQKIISGAINACITIFSKPVRLEEFEQIQMQAFSQAKSYLKDVYVYHSIV